MEQPRTKTEFEQEISRLSQRIVSLEKRLTNPLAGHFRDIAASTKDWVWEIDAEGRYISSSAAVEGILGYTSEEILGCHFYDFFYPAEREALKAAALEIVKERRPFISFRNRNVHKNGHSVILETSGFPILGLEGDLLGYRGAGCDITTQDQVERDLRASREQCRTQYKGIPIPTYSWHRIDDDFELVDYNDAAVEITDGGIKRYLGAKASEMYAEHPEIVAFLKRCFTTRKWLRQEMRYRFISTGDKRDLLVTAGFVPPDFVIVHTDDITARRQAEDSLRENEERLRTLVDAMPDLIFVIDEHGRYLEAYASRSELFYAPPEEFLGKTIAEVMPPDMAAEAMAAIRTVIQENAIQTLDYSLDLPDRRRYFSSRISPLPPQDGVRRVLAVASDITERVEAEEALREANKELEVVLDTMGEGLVVLDRQHRMMRLNRKACEMFQYSTDEIIGKDYSFWCHPDFLGELKKELRERERGKVSTYEGRFLRKDGASFYAFVTGTPILDAKGDYQGSVGCLRDITKEKQLADELRELQEFNERFLQVANTWIEVVNPDGTVLLWNDEAERVSGYSREEVLGSNKIWERLYPDAAYWAKLQKRVQQTIAEGKTRGIESTIRTKDGEERVISWSRQALYDSDDKIAAWVIVGHDVTERKRSERQLREYASQVDLLNREKTRFLSMASHELRTPLTAIRGFADLLARDESLREEQRVKVARIRAQAERLNNLLRGLFDLSRVESGRIHLLPKDVDLTAILRRVIHMIKPRLDERRHTFTYDQTHLQMRAYADPEAVEQILTNLLSNAIAYTPSGGKTSIDFRDMGKMIRVDLSDNGVGISLEEQKHIFDEFYRTEKGKQLKADGSGLGLNIVKLLVEDSGGSVWVRSAGEGKGSIFSFTLPKAPSTWKTN